MRRKIGALILLATPLILSNVFAQEETVKTNLSIKEKYDLAIKYFLDKDYKNAHNVFSEILSDEPAPYKAIIYFNMGICLQIDGVAEREKGNEELSQALFAQAATYYQKVQEIMPYFPQLYSNTGLIEYYQHKPDSVVNEMTATAQKLSDELGAFSPDIDNEIYSYRSYEALLSIAENYIANGNFLDAAKILKNVISQMEKSPPNKEYLYYSAYNSLGSSLFNVGDIEGAINSFEASIKNSPSQPKLNVSYANLGLLYFKQGNYAKSKEAIEKALAINPNNQTALDYQSKLKDTLGK